MKKYSDLTIIQKIFIKEYAQRKFNLRYHTNKPNCFNSFVNEIGVVYFLSCNLSPNTPKR